MGVDTKLFVSTRWELDDIKDVLERTQGQKVEVKSNDSISIGFFNFNIKGRSISIFTNSLTPLGSATYLSMRADEQSHKILRDVAECLGGMFQPYDYEEIFEMIRGSFWDEDGLAFFLKHAIITDGIGADDMDGLVQLRSNLKEKFKGGV